MAARQKRIELDCPASPQFASVTGLTNTTLDPSNIVPGRAASEGQLKDVYDTLADVRTYVDENTGASDELFAAMQDTLDDVAALVENCGATETGAALLAAISDKLDALETKLDDCVNRPCFGSGTDGCDGNVITVSFAWNGADPVTDGGTVSAVSAMSDHNITGFYFLVRDRDSGYYYRARTVNGGDYVWAIDDTGAVTAAAGTSARYAHVIVAADDHGCEGMCLVDLPAVTAPGGGGT